MRRAILAPVLAAVATLVVITAAPAATPSVAVLPGSGGQFQPFTVTGTGFTPLSALTATFVSPDAEEFPYYPSADTRVVVADGDGRVTITVVPAVDFAGARAGRWRVSLCSPDSGECWSAEFTVSR